MKCWICGVEPELIDVSTFQDAQPRYVAGRWPAGDHTHAEHPPPPPRPPTPQELADAGDEAFNEATVGIWRTR